MPCRHRTEATLDASPGQLALQLGCHLLMPAPHGVHLCMHLHHKTPSSGSWLHQDLPGWGNCLWHRVHLADRQWQVLSCDA